MKLKRKKIIILKLALVSILLLSLNSCCEQKIVIKKEYIKCKYPTIFDLNYTNDTNYSMPNIDYEVIEEF